MVQIKTRTSLLLACLFSFNAFAEIVVVVHPENNSQLDKKSIERLFIGKAKKFSDDVPVVPINQPSGSAEKEQFNTVVLNKTETQITAYWAKRVFTGKGSPPQEVQNNQKVIEVVALNRSAIGYVDSSAVTDAVKAIPIN